MQVDLKKLADMTTALFLTAALLFRFTQRRTLAEFAPFDWLAAVAAGSIFGRAATASDTSWLAATTAPVCLLITHTVLTRLRFVPRLRRAIDPPTTVLIRDGVVHHLNLRRCGLTHADLQAVLRQHGRERPEGVNLAILEAKGAISVLRIPYAGRAGARHDVPPLSHKTSRRSLLGWKSPEESPISSASSGSLQVRR